MGSRFGGMLLNSLTVFFSLLAAGQEIDVMLLFNLWLAVSMVWIIQYTRKIFRRRQGSLGQAKQFAEFKNMSVIDTKGGT